MTKKQLILTINEDVIAKAKDQIPNISQFVENCLKNYLGIETGIPVHSIHELNQTIANSQLQIYLMNEKGKIEENKIKTEKIELRRVWMALWREYRTNRKYSQEVFDKAIEVFQIPADELDDILDVLYVEQYDIDIDITDWNQVYEKLGE